MRFLTLFLFLFLGLSSIEEAFSISGDEENKVQEKALSLAIDNGKESPEIDEYLQKKDLKEDEMDYFEDDTIDE